MISGLNLDWPFFESRHRDLSRRLGRWCDDHLSNAHAKDVDGQCRALVHNLGSAGFLELCVSADDTPPDVRSLAIARSILPSCLNVRPSL